jgi:hypothetical protein
VSLDAATSVSRTYTFSHRKETHGVLVSFRDCITEPGWLSSSLVMVRDRLARLAVSVFSRNTLVEAYYVVPSRLHEVVSLARHLAGALCLRFV